MSHKRAALILVMMSDNAEQSLNLTLMQTLHPDPNPERDPNLDPKLDPDRKPYRTQSKAKRGVMEMLNHICGLMKTTRRPVIRTDLTSVKGRTSTLTRVFLEVSRSPFPFLHHPCSQS